MFSLLFSLFLLFFPKPSPSPYVVVLGIAQDAGYPQADCSKECCAHFWEGRVPGRKVTSIGVVDPTTHKIWLIDATPDFREQLRMLQAATPVSGTSPVDGIFLTHAHIGHYTGLMHLGREVMGARQIPVFAMPRMTGFLEENGPWNQLIDLENISLQQLAADSSIRLAPDLTITPFLVPHRDEYSETVGYRIESRSRSLVFIPDIDKWETWDRDIRMEVQKVDYALVDGTFFRDGELPGRDMSEIPHPFIQETTHLLSPLTAEEKAKVHFIHFNHTNPLLWDEAARQSLETLGFKTAFEGQRFDL